MGQSHQNIKGSTLPLNVQASRAKVLEDMYVLSIPTAKLDNKRLLALIQEPHENLGGKEACVRSFLWSRGCCWSVYTRR